MFLSLGIVCLIVAVAAYGQVLYGSLTGTITDTSGAAVVGAKVQALNGATGVAHQATTDSSGIYRLTTLLPGTYKVTVTAPGFSTQETRAVQVRVNEVAHLAKTNIGQNPGLAMRSSADGLSTRLSAR